MKNNSNIVTPLWFIVIFLGFLILYFGKNIFSLLIITFLFLILFSGIFQFFQKYIGIKSISALFTGGTFISFFLIIGFIISSQIGDFMDNSNKLIEGYDVFISNLGFIGTWIQQIQIGEIIKNIDFSSMTSGIFNSITSIFGGILTVGILLIFILLEQKSFQKKIKKVVSKNVEKKLNNIYIKIYDDINTFIVSKFFVALVNATISFIVMFLFGLEYALLFALFVFCLDFIPTVGGVIALCIPFLYSFVQFDTIGISFLLLFCLIVPQFITGNIIEPKLMGNRLNLSGFIILISLIFWSSFWGIIGAFLSVPIMVIINIVFSKFEITEPISILLSKNGK